MNPSMARLQSWLYLFFCVWQVYIINERARHTFNTEYTKLLTIGISTIYRYGDVFSHYYAKYDDPHELAEIPCWVHYDMLPVRWSQLRWASRPIHKISGHNIALDESVHVPSHAVGFFVSCGSCTASFGVSMFQGARKLFELTNVLTWASSVNLLQLCHWRKNASVLMWLVMIHLTSLQSFERTWTYQLRRFLSLGRLPFRHHSIQLLTLLRDEVKC